MRNFMNYVTPPPQQHNAGLEFDNLAKCVYSSVSYLSFDEFFSFHGYLTFFFHDKSRVEIVALSLPHNTCILAWKSLSKGQQFHNMGRGIQNLFNRKNIATWRSCQSSLSTIWSTETVTKILKQGPWISTLA